MHQFDVKAFERRLSANEGDDSNFGYPELAICPGCGSMEDHQASRLATSTANTR